MRTGAGRPADGRGGSRDDVCKGVPAAAMGEVWRRRAVLVAWVEAAAYMARLASSLGRNFKGVWYTLGAAEGGLKIKLGSAREGV